MFMMTSAPASTNLMNGSPDLANGTAFCQRYYEFMELLDTPDASRKFMTFLEKQYCSENLEFYFEVREYTKESDPSVLSQKAETIFQKYLSPDAVLEINAKKEVKQKIGELIQSKQTTPLLFEAVREQVFLELYMDHFPRFQQEMKAGTSNSKQSRDLNNDNNDNNSDSNDSPANSPRCFTSPLRCF